MNQRIAELRKRIEETDEDQGGRKIFAAELRDAVVELALAWQASGQSRLALARRLGMNPGTLAWWMHRKAPAPSPDSLVRPVQVVEDEPPPRASGGGARCVRLPSGVCIEGLTMDEVLAVVRTLSWDGLNRWGGCRALRERWQAHIDSTLMRPVLLIDEAQEMQPAVLNELRLLASTRFDSCVILTVVLAGDERLLHKLQREELLPLASRIRVRLHLGPVSSEELTRCLLHRLKAAGAPQLMTSQLVATLCDHALGNYRTLLHMASELLAAAAQREAARLDEKLYLEVFASPDRRKPTRHAPARARR
jgi:transcriptional regulator with XRE-family HTH domain